MLQEYPNKSNGLCVRMPSSIRDGSGKAGQVVPELQLKGFSMLAPASALTAASGTDKRPMRQTLNT